MKVECFQEMACPLLALPKVPGHDEVAPTRKNDPGSLLANQV